MRKRKPYLLTLEQAQRKALEIADKIYFGEMQWPDDEWYAIADNWTLNLWVARSDWTVEKGATLYPDPNFSTSQPHPVALPKYMRGPHHGPKI